MADATRESQREDVPAPIPAEAEVIPEESQADALPEPQAEASPESMTEATPESLETATPVEAEVIPEFQAEVPECLILRLPTL